MGADKAAVNFAKHGISFEQASAANPLAVEWIDERDDYGEERFILLGMVDGRVLAVVYTERNEVIRIISAREANKHEQTIYFG